MKSGVNNNKIVFVQYVPDDCTKNQLKFAYANHKEVVKAKIQVNKELQVNDHADVTRAKFIDEFWNMWSQVRILIKKMVGVPYHLPNRLTSAIANSFLPLQNGFYLWDWSLSTCQWQTNRSSLAEGQTAAIRVLRRQLRMRECFLLSLRLQRIA